MPRIFKTSEINNHVHTVHEGLNEGTPLPEKSPERVSKIFKYFVQLHVLCNNAYEILKIDKTIFKVQRQIGQNDCTVHEGHKGYNCVQAFVLLK